MMRCAAIALVLLGCGPPPEPGDAGPPALTLGTGDTTFEMLTEGGDIELVHGPQGGWHVVVAARFSGFDPDGAVLTFEVRDGDEVLVSIAMALLERRLTREGLAYLELNAFAIFDITGPDAVVGRTVTLSANIRAGEIELTDERTATIVDRL